MNPFLRTFIADRRGVATLELVIWLPIYLLLLLGMVEAYEYCRTASVIDRTAYSLGNLVAEKAVLIDNASGTDSNDIGVFWSVAPQVAQPLDIQHRGTVIVTVVKDGGGASPTPVIAWQRKPSWGAGDVSRVAPGNPLPAGFSFNKDDNTVIVEVFYHFSPFNAARTFWPSAPVNQVFYRRVYFRPRFQNIDTLQAP
ncbi:TadE/TadG family type IV pilus assembly protein [Paludibacterium purpuratum]|uniref:Putative Tad (Tight adherence macromolecular transport) pilin TadF n=1 Tax=Paludibacterium purpuratum TaxID=1144873 RepID=A0A4V3DVB0_9NEIS|nr:TadE/TadG family type IV pilus assembly protein [Paludibacterium purpuratum]TDR80239.1 putative Tad (Tight adherence macromolecular transport) pilin TadF [Paludibacterium purpuratum]